MEGLIFFGHCRKNLHFMSSLNFYILNGGTCQQTALKIITCDFILMTITNFTFSFKLRLTMSTVVYCSQNLCFTTFFCKAALVF